MGLYIAVLFSGLPEILDEENSEDTSALDSTSRDFLDKAIKDYNEMEDANWSLSEDEINQIVDLMVKIKALGIDYNTLLDQASDIYAKFGDKLSADDLSSLAAKGVAESIKEKVGGVFTGIYEGMKTFFSKIFGG